MPVKSIIHQNSVVSKAILTKILNRNNDFESCIPSRRSLLGQTTKQQLGNSVPKKP